MKVAEVPFVVLRFQYQIARLPLQLIEDQVAARLRSEGPARLLYERSFGALDATVGKLLGDPQLEKRGAALVERSNALSKAAKIDATATRNRQQADAKLAATHDQVVTDINEARDAAEQQAVEARTKAEQRKRAADETAEKRTVAAKKQADEAAAQRNKAARGSQAPARGKNRSGRAAGHQSRRVQARRRPSETQRGCKQARAGRPGRGAGQHREAEAAFRSRQQQLTTGGDGPWSTEKACAAARLCGRFPPAPHARLLVRSGTHRVDRRAYRKCKTDDRSSASGEHRGGVNLTGLDQPLGFGTDVAAHGRSNPDLQRRPASPASATGATTRKR